MMNEQQALDMIELLSEISQKLDGLEAVTVNLQFILAAVMFVAGFLPLITFFIGKGEK
jgi:hypothetical protein